MKNTILFKSIVLFLMMGVGSSAFAQNSRNVGVKPFSGISVSSGIDLYLTQGTSETVTIKGNTDLIKDVIVEQNGENLTIKVKPGVNWSSMFKNQYIKVYVTYKNLKELTASGGSDVFTENTLKTNALSIYASGGSDVKLNLVCKDLTINISGGSDADLTGSGENMIISASGGSDVDAFKYQVNNAKVEVNGGSDANIYVNKALEAGATGGSDVNYKGNAVLKKTSSSKSGDVNHVD